jgi:hypothetical protein
MTGQEGRILVVFDCYEDGWGHYDGIGRAINQLLVLTLFSS